MAIQMLPNRDTRSVPSRVWPPARNQEF